jgi:hypothetical protein
MTAGSAPRAGGKAGCWRGEALGAAAPAIAFRAPLSPPPRGFGGDAGPLGKPAGPAPGEGKPDGPLGGGKPGGRPLAGGKPGGAEGACDVRPVLFLPSPSKTSRSDPPLSSTAIASVSCASRPGRATSGSRAHAGLSSWVEVDRLASWIVVDDGGRANGLLRRGFFFFGVKVTCREKESQRATVALAPTVGESLVKRPPTQASKFVGKYLARILATGRKDKRSILELSTGRPFFELIFGRPRRANVTPARLA